MVTDVTATYIDDNGGIVYALTTIVDAAGNPVSVARNAGVYTLTAVPADTNYQLSGTLWTTLTITAAPVTVNGLAVTTVKLYDGNANAEVTNMGTPSPVFGSDDLTVSTLARYDDATVGENKTITAYYTLGGVDANNYMLGSATEVVTTTGSIVAPMVYDGTQADNGIGVNASGYCSGDASGIDYYLQSGNPDQYKLVYSAEAHAQGFTDVNWSTITTAGTVDVNIPANAASGNYTVALTLRNSNYPQFESTPVNVTFHVNLSRNYTMPIFSDVISIVDTCHCIDHSTVKWYHNGVYVGDGPYYQEVGGLTGSYHVTMTMNNVDSRTCEQTDLTTIVPEASSVKTVVKAYPNPAIDRVNVSIEYSFETMHTLRVMNVLGMTLVNTTFDGESTVVDFSSFGVGSYTVIVDGVVTRVIKK